MPIIYLIHGQVNIVQSAVPAVILPMKTLLYNVFYFCWLVLWCLMLPNYIKFATNFPYKMKFGDVHLKISNMTSDTLCFYTVTTLLNIITDDPWVSTRFDTLGFRRKSLFRNFLVKMKLRMDTVNLLIHMILAWNITL